MASGRNIKKTNILISYLNLPLGITIFATVAYAALFPVAPNSSFGLEKAMREQWTEICENLKKMLPSGIFKVWIAPLQVHVDACGLQIAAPSGFVANWLENKMLPTLRKAAAPVLGLQADAVDIRLTTPVAPSTDDTAPLAVSRTPHAPGDGTTQGVLPLPPVPSPLLATWRYSFADFVAGPTNTMALAAARDVSNSEGCVRTLFINAASGLGKTHLAHAVGKAIAEEHSHTRVSYLTAEEFASRFVASLRSHDVEGFKAHFHDLQVLLLEDVHFFQGKEKMQEIILGIIKDLQARGGKAIFTSSFAPRDLQQMDSGLLSHFCSGILTDIGRPTVAMRRDILAHKAKNFQVLLPERVCDFLAHGLDGDVRQLESCLNSLIFKARVLQRTPDIELAAEILNQYAQVPCGPDLQTIIRLVCETYGLDERQLRSRSRRKECVLGRNTVYYLARKHTELTLEEIGGTFNRRHSTVIKGITSVEQELARESRVGRQIASAVSLIERHAGVGA